MISVEKMNIVIKKSGKMQTLPKKGVTYADVLKGKMSGDAVIGNKDMNNTAMTNIQGNTHKLK